MKIILIAEVPSSQAFPGYLITAPPSVCAPDAIGALAVWIQNQKKYKNWMTLSAKSSVLHPGSQLLSTLLSLLAPSTSTTTSLALHFSLHSPPSPLPPPIASPPPSAAAGEPIWDTGVFTIIIIFDPYWWLSYNKLFCLSYRERAGEGCKQPSKELSGKTATFNMQGAALGENDD